jgi:7-cyano-7-deazaguanosine (preQ0) biosynthesis protein QueE
MNVSEIFYSVQGEGFNIGRPAVFIRLNMCNLSCSWCDTPYTWNWKKFDYFKESTIMTSDEIVSKVKELSSGVLPIIVITGGEPLMQQKELPELCEKLKKIYHWIEMETNGTMIPNYETDRFIDQYNVSPKLSSSGNDKRRERKDALFYFGRDYKTYFKFVVQNEDDFKEVLRLWREYNLDRTRIILMPEGRTQVELEEKSQWLIEVCKLYDLRFCSRLQVNVYGTKRGV